MKEYKKVMSSAENIQEIEFNVDTVYVRNNIKKIKNEEFEGYIYDEKQYNKDEYLKLKTQENQELKNSIAELTMLILNN